jgi:hypothetical protein
MGRKNCDGRSYNCWKVSILLEQILIQVYTLLWNRFSGF